MYIVIMGWISRGLFYDEIVLTFLYLKLIYLICHLSLCMIFELLLAPIVSLCVKKICVVFWIPWIKII
jgi:hypothetical protein